MLLNILRIFSVISIIISIAEAESCPGQYERCGGRRYTGLRCCADVGFECKRKSVWYSQCLPVQDSHCSNQEWAKCGGIGYGGETCCPAGTTCQEKNPWYSQCLRSNSGSTNQQATTTTQSTTTKTNSQSSSCSNTVWSQCGGGRNYKGHTCCPSGSICVFSNNYYSQCKPSSNSDSASSSSTTTASSTTGTTSSNTFTTTTTSGSEEVANDGEFPLYSNVLTTAHFATESGACELPDADYAVTNAVALGNIGGLQTLKFRNDLCGHVLQINCGVTPLNIIITNSNLGGGLDLYRSTWDIATGSKSPGQEYCTIKMTSLNPFTSSGYQCYYLDGWSDWYHNVALLNTNGRIVSGATMKGTSGAHRGSNPYYAFDGYAALSTTVTFHFEDGGSHQVQLSDCKSGIQKEIWS